MNIKLDFRGAQLMWELNLMKKLIFWLKRRPLEETSIIIVTTKEIITSLESDYINIDN